MVVAVKRGGQIVVRMTATVGGGTPRPLSGATIAAEARFDGSTARTPGAITMIDAAAGRFDIGFAAPAHRVGTLLLDVEYLEGGIVNSSPTIEVEVVDSGVEARVDRVITQYRESPKLLHTIRSILGRVEEFGDTARGYPDFFHLESAVGQQLTMIGNRLGWPRCHCICTTTPVFGFDCEGAVDVVGFCGPNSSWEACGDTGIGEFCITDDETYRTFLKVRIYQMLGLFDLESLKRAIGLIWPRAWIPAARSQSIIIAPMVEGIDQTDPLLQLWPRVLPVAVGVRVLYHFGTRPIFGFGEGWSGISDCAEVVPLTTEAGDAITTEGGDAIAAEFPAIPNVADWLCQIEPSPC